MAHDQRQEVVAVFDSVADTYDRVGVELFKPVAAALVDELDPQPGERALDVGCGRGAVLFPLAEAVGPTGAVTGIDLSPRMVEATVADVAAAGLADRVRVVVGDAQAPDLPLTSVEVISSSMVLFFLPDPRAALQGWRRLLVEGGRVGVSTFGPYTEAWRAVDDVFVPFLPPGMPDPRTRTGGPFGSDASMEGLLFDAGFDDVRTATTTVSLRFDDPDHWYRWSMSIGQRRMWESVPPEAIDEVRAEAYEQVTACRDEHGHLGFDQQVRLTLGRRVDG